MFAEFHFLRPLWLLGLLVLFLVPKIKQEVAAKNSPWLRIADNFLLQKLLLNTQIKKQSNIIKWLFAIFWTLAVLGLSGPTWEKHEISGMATKANYILTVEISPNLLATDFKPNRLARLQYKLYDVLEKLQGDNVAMIVYDSLPYLLSPFTQDTNIIKNFVEVFDVDMMPTSGDDLDAALQKSLELAGDYNNSNIILFYGGGTYNPSEALGTAKQIKAKGHRLFVIGVGTQEAVPMQDSDGGFIKDSFGNTKTAKIDFGFLEDLAFAGGGRFFAISPSDSEINAILAITKNEKEKTSLKQTFQTWTDMGVYVPFILLPIALILFRRGFFLAIPLLLSFPAHSFEWQDLWLNDNQQGLKYLNENPEIAAQKFNDKAYKGTAEYKSGQYDKALQSFLETGDGYNAGNALAQLGKIDEAIKSYEDVLKNNPNHEDAKFNLEYLKKQQEQQNQQQQQSQGQGQDQPQNQQGQQNQEQSQGQGQPQNQKSQQPEQSQQNPSQNQQQGQQGQPQQGQQQPNNQQNPEWQIENPSDSQKNNNQSQEQNAWLGKIENKPYDLLKAKLRLIHEKEYNKK